MAPNHVKTLQNNKIIAMNRAVNDKEKQISEQYFYKIILYKNWRVTFNSNSRV